MINLGLLQIKDQEHSMEFVYREGEVFECLMQVAPSPIPTSLLYMHFVLNNALFKETPSHTQHVLKHNKAYSQTQQSKT